MLFFLYVCSVISIYIVGFSLRFLFPGNRNEQLRQGIRQAVLESIENIPQEGIKIAFNNAQCQMMSQLYPKHASSREMLEANLRGMGYGNICNKLDGSSLLKPYIQSQGSCNLVSSEFLSHTRHFNGTLDMRRFHIEEDLFSVADKIMLFTLAIIGIALVVIQYRLQKEARAELELKRQQESMKQWNTLPVLDTTSRAKKLAQLQAEAKKLDISFEDAPPELFREEKTHQLYKFPVVFVRDSCKKTWELEEVQEWFKTQRGFRSIDAITLPNSDKPLFKYGFCEHPLERNHNMSKNLITYLERKIKQKKAELAQTKTATENKDDATTSSSETVSANVETSEIRRRKLV